MSGTEIYWLVAGILSLLALACFFYRLKDRNLPYFACNALLTPAELQFYRILRAKLPAHIGISFKTRLNDIINCSDKDWHRGFGPQIAAKHIDFVLYDRKTTEILACIELDDKSHQAADRQRRDKFINEALAAASVTLIRIQTANTYPNLSKDLQGLFD